MVCLSFARNAVVEKGACSNSSFSAREPFAASENALAATQLETDPRQAHRFSDFAADSDPSIPSNQRHATGRSERVRRGPMHALARSFVLSKGSGDFSAMVSTNHARRTRRLIDRSSCTSPSRREAGRKKLLRFSPSCRGDGGLGDAVVQVPSWWGEFEAPLRTRPRPLRWPGRSRATSTSAKLALDPNLEVWRGTNGASISPSPIVPMATADNRVETILYRISPDNRPIPLRARGNPVGIR